MPFRSLFRQHGGSPDFHHNQPGFQRHPQLAIVDPESVHYSQWHEMDFTTAPLGSSMGPSNTSPAQQKYPANMDTDNDSLAFLRSSTHRQNSAGSLGHPTSQSQSPDGQTLSGDLYTTGPFSYSQLLNMDPDLTSMPDQSSLSSSRTDPDSNMLNDDSTMTALSMADSLNTSPPVANLNPMDISLSSTKSDAGEKLCPLIAGQVDSCQPQRCGPDAPCMNFTTLPPIEECTSVPCITHQSVSPNETMITSDSVSVSLHQRPGMSSRGSTSTTNRSSTRRSSASSNDQQVQSVPLPPRKSTAAAARRKARNAAPPPPPTTTATMASDDDEDEQSATQSTAPSKADAKQRAKQAHSLVERKYRENLNAKIAQLHTTLQSSHYGPQLEDDGDSDTPAQSAVPASKVRKSDVLTEAMNYVNQTEVEMRHMENEIQRLGERVHVLEKLVRCEDCSLLKQMVNMQVQAV